MDISDIIKQSVLSNNYTSLSLQSELEKVSFLSISRVFIFTNNIGQLGTRKESRSSQE